MMVLLTVLPLQTIPAELASLGYNHQLCIDFSTVVVDMMTKRHSKIPGIQWKVADVRDLDMLSDQSINVALDKGTLDAMIHGSGWNPPDEVKDNTTRYMREVYRILKEDGIFLYITFRQAQFIRPLLNPDGLWHMTMHVLQSEEGTFPYYGYVIRKSAPHSEDASPLEPEGAAPTSVELEGTQLESGTVRSEDSRESSPVDPDNLGALFSTTDSGTD